MKILIIDIETTGFLSKDPRKSGKIVEVGIVRLNLKNGKRKELYSQVIHPEIERAKVAKSWIVKQGYMSTDEIMEGEYWEDVKEDIQKIITDHKNGATAFNRKFDMDFLESYGIKFPKLLPCPMLRSTDICKLPGNYGKYKWPKAEEAYDFFFPDNNYTELHRGADDAMHEAEIVYALHLLDKFLPTMVIKKGGFQNENSK